MCLTACGGSTDEAADATDSAGEAIVDQSDPCLSAIEKSGLPHLLLTAREASPVYSRIGTALIGTTFYSLRYLLPREDAVWRVRVARTRTACSVLGDASPYSCAAVAAEAAVPLAYAHGADQDLGPYVHAVGPNEHMAGLRNGGPIASLPSCVSADFNFAITTTGAGPSCKVSSSRLVSVDCQLCANWSLQSGPRECQQD
jgi:hypothetical protein